MHEIAFELDNGVFTYTEILWANGARCEVRVKIPRTEIKLFIARRHKLRVIGTEASIEQLNEFRHKFANYEAELKRLRLQDEYTHNRYLIIKARYNRIFDALWETEAIPELRTLRDAEQEERLRQEQRKREQWERERPEREKQEKLKQEREKLKQEQERLKQEQEKLKLAELREFAQRLKREGKDYSPERIEALHWQEKYRKEHGILTSDEKIKATRQRMDMDAQLRIERRAREERETIERKERETIEREKKRAESVVSASSGYTHRTNSQPAEVPSNGGCVIVLVMLASPIIAILSLLIGSIHSFH